MNERAEQITGVCTQITPEELLVANEFLELVQMAVHLDLEEEPGTLAAISDYIRLHPTEFIDPITPEAELKSVVKRIDSEIGDFIQSGQPVRSFGMCDMSSLHQLSELFNSHNLLALGSMLLARNEQCLTAEDADMLFRYRVVLQRIYEARCHLSLGMSDDDSPLPKVGARTWAGDVHPYACDTGVLVVSEYFEQIPPEEVVAHTIVAGDGTITVRRGFRIDT